jgi:hypothetical protein
MLLLILKVLKYIDAYTFLCSLYWDIFWGFTYPYVAIIEIGMLRQ